MTTKLRSKPKRAHSVSWQPCRCGCGHFYIDLLEPGGRAFAQAWFDRDDLLRVADALYATAADPTPEPRVTH